MSKYHAVLMRHYEDSQTIGHMMGYKDDKLICVFMTLEPVNNGNQKAGCVPEGTYKVVREFSQKFKAELLELKDVPDRSEIKIHVMTYARQSLGCIGLGLVREDINKDGLYDINQSKIACDTFFRIMPKEFNLIIVS